MKSAMLPLLLLLAVAGPAAAKPTAYEALEALAAFDFPPGIIPEGVVSYTLDNATGDYQIELASSCYVWFGDHYVYFDKNLSGTISHGAITNRSGGMAKKRFLWGSITSMTAHLERGVIEFRAGFITEDVPASRFQEIPVCVDGVGEQLRGAAGVVRELGLLPVAEV